MANTNTARVYVGTYAKYSGGSINGAWVDLDDHADIDDFIDACKALHSDEADPELMFQDYEGFPESYYSESSIDAGVWEWLELNDDEQDMLAAYLEHVDQDGTIEDARDTYHGQYDTRLEFAYERVDSTGMLSGLNSELGQYVSRYFDYDAFARDLFSEGFIWADGHVFSR